MNPFQRTGLEFRCFESQKLQKAAVIIQTNFRSYCARKLYAKIIYCNYVKKANAPVIKIQKAWRKYNAMCKAKLLALSKTLSNYYSSKATKIASWYKGTCSKYSIGRTIQQKIKFYSIAISMLTLIKKAANTIKYGYIGYKVRKLYKEVKRYEKNYASVKWAGPGKCIELIGSMTKPPWTIRLKMDYCNLRHIHVKYFSKLKEGIYYYNYIVDGTMCVDKNNSEISYMRLRCNQLKVAGKLGQTKDMPFNWYNIKQIPKKLEANYVTQQPAFQVKDFAETPEEYDFFNELLKKPKNKPRSSIKNTNLLASLNEGDEKKVVEHDREISYLDRLNVGRRLSKGEWIDVLVMQRADNNEIEDKGGKVDIDFNMAYNNYEY